MAKDAHDVLESELKREIHTEAHNTPSCTFVIQNGSLSNLESRKDFSNEALHLPIGEQHIRKLARGSQNIERSARDSLLSDFSLKKDPARIFDYAVLSERTSQFHGAQATLNVWGLPDVGANQSSSFRVLLASGDAGPPNTLNVIGAGWHVFPELYGDHDTHLMAYWSTDGFQSTGCYNLLCKGFVPYYPSKYGLGSKIRPLSTYDGDQYDITLKNFKDNTTGDWVLHAGRGADKRVGHWPKSLFTNLAEAASFVQFVVQFGAFVSYHPVDRAPPMGSGHFPDDCDKRAAYLKDAFVFNPVDEADVPSPVVVQSKPDCYRVGGGYRSYARDYIGGPGGCSA
ncbi:uncharacterized protein LOC109831398 [Asparagus officinalis]|uniref:uncharacterized protein LOC109831398 n=1 Tax=Asparagus officinalis TaxID=4686 RepID=UPI00098E71DB|nr:uncharacterized protein LOC109831398 [Asparagus officinalis]